MDNLAGFDPTGPGTPAWNAFGNAVRAFHQSAKGQHNGRKNKTYKQYNNFRQHMINKLRQHGASVDEWIVALRRDCEDHEIRHTVQMGDY